jgi:hypothetical protein
MIEGMDFANAADHLYGEKNFYSAGNPEWDRFQF